MISLDFIKKRYSNSSTNDSYSNNIDSSNTSSSSSISNKVDIDEILLFKKDYNTIDNDSDDDTVKLSTISSSLSLASSISSKSSSISSSSSSSKPIRITTEVCKRLNFYQSKHLYSISDDYRNINADTYKNTDHTCNESCTSCAGVKNAPTPASSPTRFY